MNIYLAGGLRSNWQDRAMIDGADYYDPRTLNDGRPLAEVAAQELRWLDACDAVFAYLERDNPSGLGMSAEIGYARARGKRIIFVDERNDRYSAWLRELCDYSTTDLEEGIARLAQIVSER